MAEGLRERKKMDKDVVTTVSSPSTVTTTTTVAHARSKLASKSSTSTAGSDSGTKAVSFSPSHDRDTSDHTPPSGDRKLMEEESFAGHYQHFRKLGDELGLKGADLAQFVMMGVKAEEEKEERMHQVEEERRERARERKAAEVKAEREREAERKEREAERKEKEAERKEREAERKEREKRWKAEKDEKKREREERQAKEERKREERQAKEEREERRWAAEQEEKQREREERQAKEAYERDERTREREQEQQRLQEMSERLTATTQNGGRAARSDDSYRVKIEPFDEKDGIDVYLAHFEQTATSHNWSKAVWATRLSPVLKGRAREAFLRLKPEHSGDYDKVKEALLKEYQRTPEYYRRKFREIRKDGAETFDQFLFRLEKNAKDWFRLASVDTSDGEKVFDMLLMEQLMACFSPELEEYVRERKPTSSLQVAELANDHAEARRDARRNHSTPVFFGHRENNKNRNGKKSESEEQNNKEKNEEKKKGHEGKENKSDITCWKCNKKGHLQRQCKMRVMKTIVGDEEVSVKQPSVLCADCEKKPYEPIVEAIVNDTLVTAHRDTGANQIYVRKDLVKKADYTGRTVEAEMGDTEFAGHYPTAWIELKSPFFHGKVLAVVMEHLRVGVYIGDKTQLYNGDIIKIPVYAKKEFLLSVQTRAQAKNKDIPRQVEVPNVEGLNITPSELSKLQKEDPSLKKATDAAKSHTKFKSGQARVHYKESKGILKRVHERGNGQQTQVCVPKSLRTSLIQLAHDPPMGGHLGAKRTTERIWSEFYWPGMCADIRRYCQSCDLCQKFSPRGRVAKVPLGKMPLIGEPFERVAVDLVGPIKPASDKGYQYILVMVDYATRYPEAIPLKNIRIGTVAEALWTMWTRLGIPKEVLSDRGTQFTGEIMKEVHRLLAIKGKNTSPYHAQCNGLVERFNGTLKNMLKKLCHEKPKTWDTFIAAALFAYREVPQESTGFSPFELLYGRTVRGPMSVLRNAWTKEEGDTEVKTTSAYVFDLRNRIEETCRLAKESVCKESARQKLHFDKKAKPRTFTEGDKVLLLLPTKHNKLEMAWRGPFPVEKRVGECDYQIKMGNKTKLFHANLLKLYIEREKIILAAVAVVTDHDDWEEVKTTKENIPTIPLVAEETVEDIHLDPNLPDWHEKIIEIARNHNRVVTDLPLRTTLTTCGVQLMHDQPLRTRQYPLPYSKRETVKKEVEEMLRMGVIEPSNSPYSSPIVLVEKDGGKKIRFCSDLRKINKIVVFDAEPMPDMEYLFAKLGKARYLSKIDLSKGYWQVPLVEEDRPKTAFSTPDGEFQWTVMPFGLKTAGAVFSRMMRSLLRPLKMPEIDNFMDDVLIGTETMDRHLECLEALFSRLEEVSLSVKPSKCFLGFQRLEYLGHVVGQGQITPQEDKMGKIRDAPRPKTKTEIRSFLGLANFYRRFLGSFADIALPLTEATKKNHPNVVEWTDDMEIAFHTLKERLSSEPVCCLPDFGLPFILRTDASDVGLGALLLQDQGAGLQPVACASKKLTGAEKNYSTIEKECFAVVWGMKRFDPYLYGRTFIVQSDHKPLEYLQGMKAKNKRLMRWALQLQPFSYTLQAIPGKENVGADYLSRMSE